MTGELVIKDGYIVTVDPELGDLPEGDVLVRDDIIAAVGPGLTASAPDAEEIDARDRLVIPGLVDTHRHVWQGAIGGFTPQVIRGPGRNHGARCGPSRCRDRDRRR